MGQPGHRALPLRQAIRPTAFIEAWKISKKLGFSLILASETFQHTGSFKFRAAYNVASQVPQQHLLTASSGNFGQALSYACSLLGKSCTVVMPATAATIKIEAVKEYGGKVELVNTLVKSRNERVKELAVEYPDAYVTSAFDDPLVIEGNASLGEELCHRDFSFDDILVPIGGGGLSSGIITAVRRNGKAIRVIGAEPQMANDAARSLQAGHLIANEVEPQTIADGARSLSVGKSDWPILKEGLFKIIEVTEEKIKEAVRVLFLQVNLKAEPTGALSIGALLTEPEFFRGRSVCCVISGGNVDPKMYAQIINEV